VQLVTPQRRNGLYNMIGVLQNKIATL